MMGNEMKSALVALCCLPLAAAANLTQVRSVYILPMGHNLDQFIADRLTRMHVFEVVTDPARADAVITGQVGAVLEDRLNELYPPPEKKATRAKPEQPQAYGALPSFGDTANTPARAGNMATFGRNRGTVFLVDVKSRQVLWSMFELPRGFSPHELDRTAEKIAKRLKQDYTPKKERAKKDGAAK
jgi:hypothetical protein